MAEAWRLLAVDLCVQTAMSHCFLVLAGFAFFGIYGTERNMKWLEEVQASVPKGVCGLLNLRVPSGLPTYPLRAQSSLACTDVTGPKHSPQTSQPQST